MERRTMRILILDDDPRNPETDPGTPDDYRFFGRPMYVQWINKVFGHKLNRDYSCEILEASTADEFKLAVAELPPGECIDLAIVDMVLSTWSRSGDRWTEGPPQAVQGREVADRFARHPQIRRLTVLTAFEKTHSESELIAKGALEYWAKLEMSYARFSQEIESIFELPSRFDLSRFYEALKKQGTDRSKLGTALDGRLVGDHPSMLRVRAQICEAILSDIPVLIVGETGTGKEEVAKTIHEFSRRGLPSGHESLVALNCAEFVEEDLLRAELFGHTKGAFTGAEKDRKGRFFEADGSTLFLDEVGLASPRFQTLMLRAMEEKRATALGGSESAKSDVRFIAATDQDVFGSTGFSKAFLHRLSGMIIYLPPLRERKSDIKKLVERFVSDVAPAPRITEAAWRVLDGYDWPGNVRQLKYIVHLLSSRARLIGQTLITRHDIDLLLPKREPGKEVSAIESRFDSYMRDGVGYDAVKARFLADYVHFQHEQISGGDRSNAAYARTAEALDCSVSTLKGRLGDYRRLYEVREKEGDDEGQYDATKA